MTRGRLRLEQAAPKSRIFRKKYPFTEENFANCPFFPSENIVNAAHFLILQIWPHSTFFFFAPFIQNGRFVGPFYRRSADSVLCYGTYFQDKYVQNVWIYHPVVRTFDICIFVYWYRYRYVESVKIYRYVHKR
jgi:hypothetical protein